MHLRSRKSITSRASRQSRVSTEESWAQAREPLRPIAEESSSIFLSTSTSTAGGSSNTMGDLVSRGNHGAQPRPPQGGNNAGHKGATRLVLFGKNMHGAYLYMDPKSKLPSKWRILYLHLSPRYESPSKVIDT